MIGNQSFIISAKNCMMLSSFLSPRMESRLMVLATLKVISFPPPLFQRVESKATDRFLKGNMIALKLLTLDASLRVDTTARNFPCHSSEQRYHRSSYTPTALLMHSLVPILERFKNLRQCWTLEMRKRNGTETNCMPFTSEW